MQFALWRASIRDWTLEASLACITSRACACASIRNTKYQGWFWTVQKSFSQHIWINTTF